MMLYVFHVDVGRMMSFDMTVALSSVENLKDTIERLHGIPAANIVLLVSGGEMLTESTQVSYYSAGTDTNPIYMFLTGDVKVLPPTMPQTDTDHDLRGQVERSMELPAVYDTVVTRTQLAVKMYEHAREEERLCERLVQDQHLQQQGWAAVVANMEDLTEEFRLRFRNFCTFFDRHLSQRTRHFELLQNFNADLSKLSRIPILPGLMPLAEADFHGFDEYLDNDDVFSRSHNQQESILVGRTSAGDEVTAVGSAINDACDTSTSTSPNKKAKMGENPDPRARQGSKTEQQPSSTSSSSTVSGKNVRRITLNLLQWITSKENHNALQTMSIECVQGLSTFNEEIYEKLKSEVQNTINIAEQGDVKEIRGLGERLCKLDEFKYKIKNMVQEQKEHSTGFQQNQSRAINLRDPSILPDLCDSHRSQMQVMLQNHQKILEHRRCIAKAKDELGTNLHMRLNRIVCIENAMSDIDNRLLFYHRYLRRAERHISIIEQIHQAPCIYVGAVTEVVRRKIFSEEFGKWASKLSDDFDSIHSEEIKRREMFNASFEGHFLNILFPGMNDMPPAFANENPLTFDARLPNLNKSDIELLSSYLPDLSNQIRLPDMWPVIKFFVSRSGDHQKERWEQLLKQQEANELATLQIDTPQKPQNTRLTDLQKATTIEMSGGSGGGGGGCDESETDTEIEFEKVPAACASGITPEESKETKENEVATLTRSTLTECLLMTSAETLTDENGTSIRDEVERLRQLLSALSQHSLDCIRMARCSLKTFRTDAEAYSSDLQADIQSLHDTCKLVRMRCEEREQELLQQNHTKDEELEMLREQLKSRNIEIERLQAEVCNLNSLRDKYDLLAEQIKDEIQATFNREKETAVALAREELIHEHKTEIESLRCRFKLMTSMERSPSDMSLEKIERPNSRIATTTDEINQPPAHPDQSDMIELKQHEAIRAQLQAEKERAVNAAVEAERNLWQSKLTLNSESVMANVGILKVIEEKERQLEQLRERELMLTKENFQLKTRLDALTNEDANSWLKEKIEYLHRDKERLEKELEKTRRLEMEGSYAGPPRSLTYEHNIVARSKSSSSSHKYIVLQTLEKGDVVFTVWSTTYGQYIVVQDSQNLFFVHGDSLAGLQLQLPKREIESPVALTDESTTTTPTIPIPFYAVGVVVEKEYCQARKDENRYRVPRGSKFYRVKIAPLAIAQPTVRVPRDRLESCSKSVSRSQSQCESQSECNVAPLGAVMTAAVSTSVMQLPTPVPISEGTTSTTAITTTTTTRRIRSTGSKSEEEESLQLSERCRYVSVNEEEESSVTNTGNQQQQQQPQQQQSVITEQPTASNQLKLDLMLLTTTFRAATTTTITTTTALTTTTTTPIQQDPIMAKGDEDSPKEHKEIQSEDQLDTANTSSGSDPCLASASAVVVATSTEIPIISFGTTSEDSDEYRSLEGKEEDIAFSALD